MCEAGGEEGSVTGMRCVDAGGEVGVGLHPHITVFVYDN
jgi:hypothetical protein